MAETFNEIYDVMDLFGKRIVRDSKLNLSRQGVNASKELSNSLKSQVNVLKTSGAIELEISMEDYGKFVDQGVRGHGRGNWKSSVNRGPRGRGSPFQFKSNPPTKVFLEWLKIKPIQTDNPKQAAFLMARSAGRYGLVRTQFISKAVKKHLPKLQKALAQAFTNDVNEFIKREILQIQKI